jgi:hypothetical protein
VCRGPACRGGREAGGLCGRGRWPAAGRQVDEPVRTAAGRLQLLPPFHRSRATAGRAMDLAGLLLDEEGTFSLTGFQDFTVSAQPAPFPSLQTSGAGTLGAPLPARADRELACLPCRGLGGSRRSSAYARPWPFGPGGRAAGYRKGNRVATLRVLLRDILPGSPWRGGALSFLLWTLSANNSEKSGIGHRPTGSGWPSALHPPCSPKPR